MLSSAAAECAAAGGGGVSATYCTYFRVVSILGVATSFTKYALPYINV